MKKSKETIREERKFLRLCGRQYKEMVQGKREMTVNDFNRICCAITRLNLFDYYIHFTSRFGSLFNQSLEEADRREAEYALLYSKRDNLYAEMDTCQTWLREFWEQIPLEGQKKRYRELFWIDYDITNCVAIV